MNSHITTPSPLPSECKSHSCFHSIKLFAQRILRIGMASARGYTEDECSAKASALTFYSLLSIVPVLAVGFGIAKGFGFEKLLESELLEKFPEQHEVTEKFISFAYNLLLNTQGGVIAGVGLIVLFWSVLQLLSSIETAFNDIWKLPKQRSLSRRFSDYLAIMFFSPIFLVITSSLLVFVMTKLIYVSKEYNTWISLSPMITLTLQVAPSIISWVLFTLLYWIIPNTKVPMKSAIVAGVVTGTTYQIVQWIYIQFQIGLASYGAIYGSFAALPLFLIWLNTSWLITLAGAEIAYHTENDLSIMSSPHEALHLVDERILGIMIMQDCIQSLNEQTAPPTTHQLAKHLGVTVITVRHLVRLLFEAGLLIEVNWKDGTSGRYLPGRSPDLINFASVCNALDSSLQKQYYMKTTMESKQYQNILSSMDSLVKNSPLNIPLQQALSFDPLDSCKRQI